MVPVGKDGREYVLPAVQRAFELLVTVLSEIQLHYVVDEFVKESVLERLDGGRIRIDDIDGIETEVHHFVVVALGFLFAIFVLPDAHEIEALQSVHLSKFPP